MNTKILAAAGAVLLVPAVSHAEGWLSSNGGYVRAEGGISNLDDNNFNTTPGRVDVKYKDAGWLAGAAVGVQHNAWRYEVEGLHQENDVKNLTLNGAPQGGADGTAKLNAAMGNVYYDFGSGPLKPYIGGGVGAANVNMSNVRGGGVTYADDDDTVLAYQGMAGVRYDLNPCWALNAEYRYLGTNDAHINTAGGKSKVAYDTNNVIVGLAYKF